MEGAGTGATATAVPRGGKRRDYRECGILPTAERVRVSGEGGRGGSGRGVA
jgi:hypothetical protein